MIIPIPHAEIDGKHFGIEFDPAKITVTSLSRDVIEGGNGGQALEPRSRLTLTFDNPEDMPKWVELDVETNR